MESNLESKENPYQDSRNHRMGKESLQQMVLENWVSTYKTACVCMRISRPTHCVSMAY